MTLQSKPLPSVPQPVAPPTSDITSSGPPIPAIDRLRLMDNNQWEKFILEWAHSLEEKYAAVEQCGGAGDMGRDVLGFLHVDQADPWDNYQCKHYDHPLHPGDIWVELGKLCYFTFIGEYTYPREYFFVAPQGIGNALSKLLREPAELKAQLFAEWDSKCRKYITSKSEIPLESKLKAHIDALDFSIIKGLSPLTVIDEHRKTPWHVARFGGGLPQRPPSKPVPVHIDTSEARYVRALLDAYEERLRLTIVSEVNITDASLAEHFRRARQEFYSAESLREFSKENVPPGTFDNLLDEVEAGVIDVIQSAHPDAYERVLNAVKQAKTLPLTSNGLVTRINNSDKGGMCHQLANNERVKWRH